MAEGEQNKARQVVLTMLRMGGFSDETISEIVGLTVAEVEAIRAENDA